MAQLSAEEITSLAESLSDISNKAAEYRQERFNDLSANERRELSELISSLLETADQLFTASAVTVIEEAQGSINALNEVIEEIKSTFAAIRKVQKAIEVTASVINLGSALVAKNPQAIGKAIAGVIKTWRTDEDT